ncbi:MAG TPA: signal recognition particle protein, partial [Solirubrobacterales bacterium]|nr:signal recognition particle protein [Solirubrobacterales bacterium]
MFDQLSDRLQATLSDVRSRGKLNEGDVDAAMREIRLALLEADVNFKVVKAFTKTLKERCLGAEVLESLDPGQQVVKIVDEELTGLMGGTGRELALASSGPTVILMAGLQGSGKTTACAKLARLLGEQGKNVALAACDVYRPAAVDQLVTVGERAGAHVYQQGTDADPVEIAAWAFDRARAEERDVLIVDTAGRLHIDEALMDELARIRKRTRPHDVLLVVDAMTGQDAVGVAESFAEAAEFDGVVMTKLDGDARGGAALSVKAVTGKPILFASTGEKLDAFERFHPDRMASRILGMGDVLTLIERAEAAVEEDEQAEMEKRLAAGQFTFDDFLKAYKMLRRMGPLKGVLKLIPGMDKQLGDVDLDESQLGRVEAIVLSMTPQERRSPIVIDGKRRIRIARGSGTTV